MLLLPALQEFLTLLRSHLFPPFPQGLPFGRRHLLKIMELLADLCLFLRRQMLECLKAFADLGALSGVQFAPALQPLPGALALRRGHFCPAIRAAYQPLLPFRRQLIPVPVHRREDALLLGCQVAPRHRCRWSWLSGGGRGRC